MLWRPMQMYITWQKLSLFWALHTTYWKSISKNEILESQVKRCIFSIECLNIRQREYKTIKMILQPMTFIIIFNLHLYSFLYSYPTHQPLFTTLFPWSLERFLNLDLPLFIDKALLCSHRTIIVCVCASLISPSDWLALCSLHTALLCEDLINQVGPRRWGS